MQTTQVIELRVLNDVRRFMELKKKATLHPKKLNNLRHNLIKKNGKEFERVLLEAEQ